MLTKKDLNQVEKIMKKSISEAFLDFYENIFEPFATKTEERFEKNDRQHKEIVVEIMEMKKDINTLKMIWVI